MLSPLNFFLDSNNDYTLSFFVTLVAPKLPLNAFIHVFVDFK